MKIHHPCIFGHFNPRSHKGATGYRLQNIRRKNISIHAPTRERLPSNLWADVNQAFQSTLPQGSDHIFVLSVLPFSISIHAPTRERLLATSDKTGKKTISIHAPTRGATMNVADYPEIIPISIHAPTRGATMWRVKDIQRLIEISIHAPTRGATLCSVRKISLKKFQSTLPQGERLNVGDLIPIDLMISIHAPTRGATHDCCWRICRRGFQSTLPQGERLQTMG